MEFSQSRSTLIATGPSVLRTFGRWFAVGGVALLLAACGGGGGSSDDSSGGGGGGGGGGTNALPTALFTPTPNTGKAPLLVSFNGSASTDSDGTIQRYQWDFGDGSPVDASGATVQHTYTTAGTYVARLTVTDDKGGTGTKTENITVQAPTGSVNVTVKDSNDIPVPGATVVASVSGSSKSGTTNSAGTVLLADVVAGTGTVTVSRSTFVQQSVPVTVTADQTTNVPVTLVRVTSAVGGVLTTSQPLATVSPDGKTLTFTIQVVVVDQSSSPIAGLASSAFNLQPCTPSTATTTPDCVTGGPDGFDAAYSVLGSSGFQSLPGGTAQPYAAMMMFDQSRSIIVNDPTDARLYSAKEFLKDIGGGSSAALAAFATNITGTNGTALIPQTPVTIYDPPGFVASGSSLFPTLDTLGTLEGGGTPLYESLCRVMTYMTEPPVLGTLPAKKAAVVFTDGKDEPVTTTGFTCLTTDNVLAKSQQTGVSIFTIGLAGEVDGKALAELAEGSGGTFLFAEDTTQLITIYGSLGNLLSGVLPTYKMTFQVTTDLAGTFQAGRAVLGVLSVSTGTTSTPVVKLPFIVRIF